MRISQLVLEGFKSFADRTAFDFHPRMTAIVGPSGGGKKGLVDAIRWVLGEGSPVALRIYAPERLIFAGTDRRKRLPEATVSLTIAECPSEWDLADDKLTITRRVHRDGTDEHIFQGGKLDPASTLQALTECGLDPASLLVEADSYYSMAPAGPVGVFVECERVIEEEDGVSSFLAYLQEHLLHRQLIVVTHEKRTMNMADELFGVTMAEFGVSKPVGMRLTGR